LAVLGPFFIGKVAAWFSRRWSERLFGRPRYFVKRPCYLLGMRFAMLLCTPGAYPPRATSTVPPTTSAAPTMKEQPARESFPEGSVRLGHGAGSGFCMWNRSQDVCVK
jgi:hypothetical protein